MYARQTLGIFTLAVRGNVLRVDSTGMYSNIDCLLHTILYDMSVQYMDVFFSAACAKCDRRIRARILLPAIAAVVAKGSSMLLANLWRHLLRAKEQHS